MDTLVQKEPENASRQNVTGRDVRSGARSEHGSEELAGLQKSLDRSPSVQALHQMKRRLDGSPRVAAQARRAQSAQNRTGLPDTLKAGVEELSGTSLDDVQVHFNSSEPAQLQALAYAQGPDIYVAPGQERYLSHEAWHVAQQKQGRVRPTMNAGGVAINDDPGLEREADTMGRAAGSWAGEGETVQRVADAAAYGTVVQRATPEELRAKLEEFNAIKRQIEVLRRLIEAPEEDQPLEASDTRSNVATVDESFNEEQLESWLQELYVLAREVVQDRDHDIFLSAYGGIYDYTDRLITRLQHMGGYERWLESYLLPIFELMRNAIAAANYDDPEAVEDYRQANPEKFAMSLREFDPSGADLEMVIAQAAYMSGDMFGVAAALRLSPGLGVVIFYDHLKNREREIENTLLDFYRTKGGEDHPRVALIPVTDSQLAYKKAISGDFSDRRLFPFGKPHILSNVEHAATIGNATRIVADAYRRDQGGTRAALEDEWLPAGTRDGTATGKGEKSIAEWVHEKGFRKGTSYAFIWFRRSGARGGAHSELDTSEVATRQIIENTRGTAADKIVLVGDNGHALSGQVDIDLTEFWKEPGSPFEGSGRKMQLALFSYLVTNGFTIMNVGMRSGALEGPALLGVKTVFLEEKYNLQEGRMDQWQDAVPGFSRVELEHVPTADGKRELQRLIELTIQSQDNDFNASVAKLRHILAGKNVKARGKPLDVEGMIERFAGDGIYIEDGIYNPDSVNNVLQAILIEIRKATGSSIEGLLKDHFPAFKRELRTAIRSYQEWSKGLVKKSLAKAYKGPDEGLSDKDTVKLWDAIGTNVGGWRSSGASTAKKKNNNKHKK